MKVRIRQGSTQQSQAGNNHSVLKQLQGLSIVKNSFLMAARHGFRLSSVEQHEPQERLSEIETARNRALGQAYLNMLPPK